MDANQTSEAVLNLVRKSNLNFKIEESPFTLTITLRKSFIKNKNGTVRRSGLESSNSTALEQNLAPFPMNQNSDDILSNMHKTTPTNREQQQPLMNPMDQSLNKHWRNFSNPLSSQKDQSSPKFTKSNKYFMHKTTTNNGKQKQPFMNPMDQSLIKPCRTYTNPSSSPLLQTYTHHHHLAQQPLPLFKTPHQSQGRIQTLTPNNFQPQDSLFNKQLSLFKTSPKHRPHKQLDDIPTLKHEPFFSPRTSSQQVIPPLNLCQEVRDNPWLKRKSGTPPTDLISQTDSRCTPLVSQGSSSTSSTSSSPSRSPSQEMFRTWDPFPFKYHPTGLNDSSDAHLSDEELDSD